MVVNTNIFRHLIFGEVDSADYGIYINGDAVYNSPERQVEMITVPGRDGLVALDMGRFENIEIVYPCGTFATTQEEFAEQLSAFRNAIMSLRGYQRLEDTYHPEEFRKAVFMSAIEVEPVSYNRAGEFELTFNCKPQRWLSVGDLPIPVDSGDVLENPSPFESGPLLEIEGYGDISFNGFTVSLEDAVLGVTQLEDSFTEFGTYDPNTVSNSASRTFTLESNLFNTGDTITVNASKFRTQFYSKNVRCYIKSQSGSGSSEGSGAVLWNDDPYMSDIQTNFTDIAFTAGTSATKTYTYTVIYQNQSNVEIGTIQMVTTIAYNYTQGHHSLLFYSKATATAGIYPPQGLYIFGGKTTVDSSLSLLGNPTYVDCDLGEAYRLENGTPVSLNSKVVLGSDLPVMAPGPNKVTFDNTITDLKIAPRWWRI